MGRTFRNVGLTIYFLTWMGAMFYTVVIGVFALVGLSMINILVKGKNWQRCTLIVALSFLAVGGREYLAKYDECNNWKRNYLCPHAETREQRAAQIAKLRKMGYIIKEDPDPKPMW